MPRIESILAYEDCREFFDRAMVARYGVRVKVPDRAHGTILRARCNKFRQLDRRRNAEIYAGTNAPQATGSIYDVLVLRLREINEQWYLIIEKATNAYEIEDQ